MRGDDTAPMPSRCDFLRAAREDSPAGKRNAWSASCSAEPYRTEVWTTKRVAEVIEKTFHVPCHYNTAGKLLHRLDWTPQKPERRALERDEQAIQRWKKKVWPRVKKTPRGWEIGRAHV